MIRDFKVEDYQAVVAMHEASGINYKLPPLIMEQADGEPKRHPLWISMKVLEVDGEIVAAQGLRMQTEAYLWLSKGAWCKPGVKMACIQGLDKAVCHEAWMQGIENAVCYIPPTMKRFVKRVVDWLGYKEPRAGWVPLSKELK